MQRKGVAMSDSTTPDPDAVEIGKLFHKAKEAIGATITIEGTVTDSRHFSQEISTSRNVNDKPPSPDKCCWCLKSFGGGQMRYPIIFDEFFNVKSDKFHTVIASLFMHCFKAAYEEENWYPLGTDRNGNAASRCNTQCSGCGEPIQTISNSRYLFWRYCSTRCYQRDYRKRRRGQNSVVDWKGGRPNLFCAVCKTQLDHYGKQHKRKDAVYCSARCRQWAYRRRRMTP